MKTLTDQLGNQHILQTPPKRIISLVPSQTELLFDLGLEENIVGITKFCVHPTHFKTTKKQVGGTKNPNYDKIKALNPDIIICNKEENTKEIIEECSKICAVWATNIISIEDNFKMITDFGEIFNCQTKSQNLNDKLILALNDFKIFIDKKPLQKVAYFIWKNPYMVVGSDNYVNEMLRLNKFQNTYENNAFQSNRYPEIKLENLKSDSDPDLIFLSSEPYPFKQEDAVEIARFTHNAKTIFVDGEMFSWHGGRFLIALEYFKLLHSRI